MSDTEYSAVGWHRQYLSPWDDRFHYHQRISEPLRARCSWTGVFQPIKFCSWWLHSSPQPGIHPGGVSSLPTFLSFLPVFPTFLSFLAPFSFAAKRPPPLNAARVLWQSTVSWPQVHFWCIHSPVKETVGCKYCSISVEQNLKTGVNVFYWILRVNF